MKKAVAFFLTAILLIAAPFSVFAGGFVPTFPVPAASVSEEPEEELEPVPFEFITGETDDFQPENEYSITFSNKITLNAESVRGATVYLTVLRDRFPDNPREYEEVVIGRSLKYMQTVSLALGDNYLLITVEKDGYETVEIEAVVKRKDANILESLQNLIIIPGFIR